MNKKVIANNWYESSKGSGLSATIGGLSIVGVIPAIMIIIKILGFDIPQEEVVKMITAITVLVGTAITIFGLGRKIYFSIKNQ